MFFMAVLLMFSCSSKKENEKQLVQLNERPNIIYILCDDLGYGDLSCYGQKKFETPNIDGLAAKGMKFTQHYSGSAVCAPSRSVLMTGQHTGHTPIRGNKEASKGEEGQEPLPASSVTIAEVLKGAGYTTGMFGKWGLGFGEGDPNNQGFDEFFGYNCQRLAHRYYPPHLNHNQEEVKLKGNDWTKTETYAPDVIQEATLKFLEDNKDKPFFAYVPFTLPHAELISPNDSIFNKYKGKFEEVPLTANEKYTSDYGPNIVPMEYCSQEMPYAAFASMVDRTDVYVGQIIEKLQELGISENTIIMFASDNGPHTEGGANPKYFNSSGGLRGVKRDLYEGGIRSPFIVVWPGKVKAGSSSSHVSAFWDIMPTLSEIAKVKSVPANDGISLVPTLTGKSIQKTHEYMYWEYNIRGGRKAVRKDKWKGVWYNINSEKKKGEFELYNLELDESEKTNVAAQNQDIVEELKQIMLQASSPSEMFPF